MIEFSQTEKKVLLQACLEYIEILKHQYEKVFNPDDNDNTLSSVIINNILIVQDLIERIEKTIY